jgi:hypothetical protein
MLDMDKNDKRRLPDADPFLLPDEASKYFRAEQMEPF